MTKPFGSLEFVTLQKDDDHIYDIDNLVDLEDNQDFIEYKSSIEED